MCQRSFKASSIKPYLSKPVRSLKRISTVTLFNTPEDHAKPDGKQAKMVFALRPASEPAQGYLFLNFGGPGGQSTQLLALALENHFYPEDLLKKFHLVALILEVPQEPLCQGFCKLHQSRRSQPAFF